MRPTIELTSAYGIGERVAMIRPLFGSLVFSFLALSTFAACKSTPQPASQDPSATPVGTPSAPPANDASPAVDGGSTETSTGASVACGPTTCKAGEVCCNASCGVCTPPGGFCTQQFCEADAGATKSTADGGSSSTGAACKIDADCRTKSSYCQETPCACLALGKSDAEPKCKGPGQVQCFADPCLKKAARCDAGHCVVTKAP